jgi:hypothetical protein
MLATLPGLRIITFEQLLAETFPRRFSNVDLEREAAIAAELEALMAITAADILWKLSKDTSPGNSTAQGNVNDSIGGYMSSTQMTDAALANLFDDVSGDENAASTVDYRAFFIHNAHGSLTWQAVKLWINSETAGGASAALGLSAEGVVPYNQAGTRQIARLASETTAPGGGVTFSSPTTKGAGLSIGDMATNTVQGVWVRRTAANTAALDLDGAVFKAEGDTAA